MKSTEYYFLQPLSDQVISIIRLIRELDLRVKLIAVVDDMTQKPDLYYKIGFTSIIMHSSLDILENKGRIVPSGAYSTEELLKYGSIELGQVVQERSVLRVYDKLWFIEHCLKSKLPVPKTFKKKKEIDGFPVFFKQKHEQGGGIRGLARCFEDIPEDLNSTLIFQEYIDSPGTYGVGFIAEKGSVKAMYGHYELISYPESGGSAAIIRPFNNERLIHLTKAIIESLDYSGWGLAEFKFCPKRNDYIFMEINAKFWASCELAFRNEPKFLNLLFGIESLKENLNGIIYLNRALRTGFFNCLYLLIKYKSFSRVGYPNIFVDFLIGILPKKLVSVFKSFRKNKN